MKIRPAVQSKQVIERLAVPAQRAFVTAPVRGCDLIAKGVLNAEQSGWVIQADGIFSSDRMSGGPISQMQLLAIAQIVGQEITFMCAPPSAGQRIAVDRDFKMGCWIEMSSTRAEIRRTRRASRKSELAGIKMR